ncbi:hypothetical protein HN800_02395 [bacterium]|jgi:hypothetical protein|nr:hypothetical protein [bacterium]MBT4334861.1 hypothetical protein [bacterium]MBT4495293.1 hypothetical protein [bacterium]MBT4763917.1 hypothetical protein [bacterium]MBT5401288.1 hypothetical protein [bacterium]
MFSTAHLASGLIIGKITGDYTTAIIASLIIDIDHFVPLYKQGIFTKWKTFKHVVLSSNNPQGSARTYLHNVFVFLGISIISYLINPVIGTVVAISYFFHLVLDCLDDEDLYILYPSKKINIKGPFGYFSYIELAFTVVLFGIYYII